MYACMRSCLRVCVHGNACIRECVYDCNARACTCMHMHARMVVGARAMRTAHCACAPYARLLVRDPIGCMYACMGMHACATRGECVRGYAHMHVCTYARMHVCTYARMHVCAWARACAHMRMRVIRIDRRRSIAYACLLRVGCLYASA